MIDWITAIIPLDHPEPITGGTVLALSADGEIDYETKKRAELTGSFDHKLYIRSHEFHAGTPRRAAGGRSIEIHGNPIKYLQGHNIFGTDDLTGLVTETMLAICEQLQLPVRQANFEQWVKGEYQLRRVDINYSWQLQCLSSVLAWIRSAEHSAHMKHRGKGELTKNGTLYYGKKSRRWGFKFYAKGDEIAAHPLPVAFADSPLQDFAQNLLRGELVLRSQELKRLNLATGANWNDTICRETHSEIMGRLDMNDTHTLDPEQIENLSPRLALTYNSWKQGQDLRQILPKNTFYRYRNELKKYGIDIAVKQPRDTSLDNVVPLVRVLEAIPAEIPDWAYEQGLVFIPRKFNIS